MDQLQRIAELLEPISKYYSNLSDNTKNNNEREKNTEKVKLENEKMWIYFHKLNDQQIVDDLVSIIIEKNLEYNTYHYGLWRNAHIIEYFSKQKIDIGRIFDTLNYTNYNPSLEPSTYWDKYGLDEKIRWQKIQDAIVTKAHDLQKELVTKAHDLQKEQEKGDKEKKIEEQRQEAKELAKSFTARFVSRAIDLGYQDVTIPMLRVIAKDLDELPPKEIAWQELRISVSTKLREHFGVKNNTRKRDPLSHLRHECFVRDNYTCVECGKTSKDSSLEADHILPVSQGGTDELSNLQTLCFDCNRSKRTKCF